MEYYDHKDSLRLERSLSFAARLNSSPLHKTRNMLDKMWQQDNKKIRKILTDKNSTQDQITRRYYEFVVNHVRDHNLTGEFLSMMDFFHELTVCINGKLCSRDASIEFFSRYVQAFLKRYYPYLCELRSSWQDDSIGFKVEKLFLPNRTSDVCAAFIRSKQAGSDN